MADLDLVYVEEFEGYGFGGWRERNGRWDDFMAVWWPEEMEVRDLWDHIIIKVAPGTRPEDATPVAAAVAALTMNREVNAFLP